MRCPCVVLFDIDGTLLWPDGIGKASIQAALEEIYGTAGPIEAYYFGGRTDREAVGDLLMAAGLSPAQIWERFPLLEQVLSTQMMNRLALGRHTICPCPGGLSLVDALSGQPDFLPGLLTGNVRGTAEIKLKAAGYNPADFLVGGFGDASAIRADLARLAIRQAEERLGVSVPPDRVVIVGDTPADIVGGKTVGARTVAVLTGYHPEEELAEYEPDRIFPDLSDIEVVLATFLSLMP
nr:HAD hydrolase-like protein [Anaerolineae bacterium]